MGYVLGIDAGGTKTVCLLADDQGNIVAEARRGGANLQASGELEVEKVLHQVMEEAIGDRAIVPAAICLGIAGVDRPDDYAVVGAIMRRIGYKARIIVVNDALVALEAGAPGQPGVVVISGTGSISYGRNAKGEAARSGGWGYVLGDEGSGYWIGRAALRAVLRQADRRGPVTVLSELLLKHFDVARSAGIDSQGLQHEFEAAPRLARSRNACNSAFSQGDAVAIGILRAAANELETFAVSVARRLELDRPAICVHSCRRDLSSGALARRGARAPPAGRGARELGRGDSTGSPPSAPWRSRSRKRMAAR